MIYVVVVVVLSCIGVSAALAWHGQAAVIAAFMAVAGQALGILSPSPLKQHGQSSSGTQTVEAPNAQQVTMNQPRPVVVEPPVPPAP